MVIILFIIVLALIVLAHELGHFLAAKQCSVRVEEFGIGFPPRLYSWRPEGSETLYSINAIPFGGFVRLYKEDEQTDGLSQTDLSRTLSARPWWQRVWVLSAGVVFNVLLAWGLLSAGIAIGLPMSVDETTPGVVGTPSVIVLHVQENSPASAAGLLSGDAFVSLSDGAQTITAPLTVSAVQTFIGTHADVPLMLTVTRGGSEEHVRATPHAAVVEGESRPVLGITLDYVGVVRLPVWRAALAGGQATIFALKNVSVGLWQFFSQAFSGRADFSEVVGPVGIVSFAGDAVRLGFVTLLSFAAMLSLNLAVINLIPFPALDGGRILFVLIETAKRSPISGRVVNTLNLVGFGLLVVLMIVVTVHDILKLI
jgi:regulator of sigma E protease